MLKLEHILKYISENNEFYKNVIKKYEISNSMDILQYPMLTRKQLQEHRYNMFSEGYKTKYFYQQLKRQSSSGSSGVPVNVYWDYKDWYASNLSLWRKRYQWYQILPSDNLIKFELNIFDDKVNGSDIYFIQNPENILTINVSLLCSDEAYLKVVEAINQFKPVWLYVQPFVLNKLINIIEKYNVKKPESLKHIEFVGEILSSDLRRRTVDFFGVTISNLYGSEEMNGIAYECPCHNMHILEDNVYAEVLNKNGFEISGRGEAVISNLNNYCMPLIRYNLEDQIILNEHQTCACGCSSAIIDVIIGRSRESVLTDKGVEINSFMLAEVISEVNNQFNDIIREYRYTFFKAKQILLCEIRLEYGKSHWFCNVKRCINNIFIIKLGNNYITEIEVKLVDAIYKNKKRKILNIV